MKRIILIMLVSVAAFSAAYEFLRIRRDDTSALMPHRFPPERKETEGKKVDQPDKFLKFHEGIRTRDGEEGPAYPPHYKWNELRLLRNNDFARARNSDRAKSNGVVEWKERGPANVPGRTRALFYIPDGTTKNTWLAGAATGGIWRTNDGGISWVEVSTGFPALPISTFGADAAASVIYAGTGEFISSFYSAIGNGIFRSTDKGMTWTQLASTNNHPEFSIVTRLIVHPSNPDVLVATTVPHNLSSDHTSAIMRSTDGGNSWTKVHEVTGYFEQIISTPSNFKIQFASQNGLGIWKSVDSGKTWNLSSDGMNPQGRMEISVSRVDPNRIFVSAEGTLSGTGSDLYYSSDQGSTWSLIDVRFNNNPIDFFEGQGFYDNTIMCDPFNANEVYFGGVSLFCTTLTGGSNPISLFKIKESSTESFLSLQAFADIPHDRQRLLTGDFNDKITVEIRFGPGQSQRAHRFLVPVGATSGVPASNYSYASYTVVPFEAWDITNNRQLMVSFRDQNRNGAFDLSSGEIEPAREYVYVSNVLYHPTTPNGNMNKTGGHEYRLMYNFFPALASGADWTPNALPDSRLTILHESIELLNATTTIVADGRGSFDDKNASDQINLDNGVHPDHHFMLPLIQNETAKTFRILLANDGGVFVSKVAANPGITDGDWLFRGFGLNTSQFYGADKQPGTERYIGGMQDNGTRFSAENEGASSTSNYQFALGGDGFEVIWNSKDPNKLLGSVYNGQLYRSEDHGKTWFDATAGFAAGSEFGFVTRLANSKDFPNRVFTVGNQGVYVSDNFGESWKRTSISQNFAAPSGSATFLDVEVSRANANIVWAGGGMFNSAPQQFIHVSADGGKTFSATNNFTDVAMGTMTKLATHPTEENTAFALFSFANAPKILRTTDRGETWTDISGFGTGNASTNGFPDVAVYCLYVRPDNTDIIWAGTEIGIVESLDNGQTWAAVPDFPRVSVWDMKGQDNEVVIATHGRGIWTATIDTDQASLPAAEILSSGTSPSEMLVLRVKLPSGLDSLEIHESSTNLYTIRAPLPGLIDIQIDKVLPGQKEFSLMSYRGDRPYQSMVHRMNHLDILPLKNSYATYFITLQDLAIDGLTLQNFPNVSSQHRKSLMTDHPYLVNKKYEVILRTPVTVSSTLPYLYYSDVALTEPGKDMVIVEATDNGLDWVELRSAYSAADEAVWQDAFVANTPGNTGFLRKHELDISEKFEPGTTLLFRLRMTSGPETTAWGWALDYVSIQELPLSLDGPLEANSLTVYPNPSKGQFTIEYKLHQPSEIDVSIIDMFGRQVLFESLGPKPAGYNLQPISFETKASGSYIVLVGTREGKLTSRVTIIK